MLSLLKKSPLVQSVFVENPVGRMAATALGYVYVLFLLPHCFLAFALLKKSKYMGPLFATGEKNGI